MSSLVLPEMSGELRRNRGRNELDRLSPLPKADSNSVRGSPHSPEQLPSDKRAGSFVRQIKQRVYSSLHKLRGRSSGDVPMSGVRRVSVLELRFGSPTNTSDEGPPHPVAWHTASRQTDSTSSILLRTTYGRDVHVLLRPMRLSHLPGMHNSWSSRTQVYRYDYNYRAWKAIDFPCPGSIPLPGIVFDFKNRLEFIKFSLAILQIWVYFQNYKPFLKIISVIKNAILRSDLSYRIDMLLRRNLRFPWG